MKRLFLATILFSFPFYAHAGFPDGENGYDLKKLKSLLNYPVMKLAVFKDEEIFYFIYKCPIFFSSI